MKSYIDQMGRTVVLEKIPKRIISLVPSQTELLFDLGLENEVVGITKFCIYPERWHQTKQRVGGTKNVHFDVIERLKPDLIIGNKEENTESDILKLEQIAPVWMSDIVEFSDAYDMIKSIGELCDKEKEATTLLTEIQTNVALLVQPEQLLNKTVSYFIWNEPFMSVGSHTFINSVLKLIGLSNYHTLENRYPEVMMDENFRPDFVFLSSEPFPFNEKHQQKIQQLLPNSKVVLVDGEYFSWYGSRMKNLPNYLNGLVKQLV